MGQLGCSGFLTCAFTYRGFGSVAGISRASIGYKSTQRAALLFPAVSVSFAFAVQAHPVRVDANEPLTNASLFLLDDAY